MTFSHLVITGDLTLPKSTGKIRYPMLLTLTYQRSFLKSTMAASFTSTSISLEDKIQTG